MTESKILSIPCPVFALTSKISPLPHPIKSTIWSLTTSGSALGKSILLIIGKISKSLSSAKYKLLIVWKLIYSI